MNSHKLIGVQRIIANLLIIPFFLCFGCGNDEVVLPEFFSGRLVVSQKMSQFQIGIMSRDGNELLTDTNVDHHHNLDPRWSPDGSQIAYIFGGLVYGKDEIHVMNSDGSSNVTINVQANKLDWSADGSEIIFVDYFGRIKSISPSGDNLRNYDIERTANDISCSNDGTRIVFSGEIESGIFNIFTVNTDGSNLIRITDSQDWESDPVWSPDDSKIAFSSRGQIFVMNADGSNRQQLTNFDTTNNNEYGYYPAWSRNGKQIVCLDLLNGMYVMDSDGSNIAKISDLYINSLDWY